MRDDPSDEAARSRSGRRVLIVTDSLANGGMERQLALLATALPAEWDVRVASLDDGVYVPVLRQAGVEVTVITRSFRYDVRPAFAVGRLIRDWQPDVVHTYGWMSFGASLGSCRSRRIPIVDASIQNAFAPTGVARLRNALTSRADVRIANSHAGLVAYGVDPRRGVVVRNGFDPERWALCDGGQRTETGVTTVVMTARMHRHKDYRSLLDAARVLGREDPGGWRFLALGSGDQRDGLVSDYADLVRSGVLEFPQAGTEVLGLVRDATIGVLLTDPEFAAEGVSNSIMEYMACGLPVVCTRIGGNPELVVEGETGLLVPPRDVAAVVSALRSLRADPGSAGRMGRAGRERIATVFTVEALVAGTLAAYEQAFGRR
jgi:glycosyltransferase involved in cell wall biosynthesis